MKRNIFKDLMISLLLLLIPIMILLYISVYMTLPISIVYSESYGDVYFVDGEVELSDISKYNFSEGAFKSCIKGISEEDSDSLLINLQGSIKGKIYGYDIFIDGDALYITNGDSDYCIFYLNSEFFILNLCSEDIPLFVDEGIRRKVEGGISKAFVTNLEHLLSYNSCEQLVGWSLENTSPTVASNFMRFFPTADLAKPVIYLYPEEPIDISVSLSGVNLITTYPVYNNCWNICAYPDGTLVDDNDREYNYLYWEGKSYDFIDISSGFVVSKNDLILFLESKLAEIGLSDKESCDFISYWLPLINEKDYVLISFQMENYEDAVSLNYSVTPDNELRVFVAFKPLDNYIDIPTQDLSYYNDFSRAGFHIVEWGGTLLSDD